MYQNYFDIVPSWCITLHRVKKKRSQSQEGYNLKLDWAFLFLKEIFAQSIQLKNKTKGETQEKGHGEYKN